jgi:hypothetical protein
MAREQDSCENLPHRLFIRVGGLETRLVGFGKVYGPVTLATV